MDLTALDTFIEFKRRIGTTGGFNPDPRNVDQLDDYLAQSRKQNRVRMGILTDGKYWLLRWPGAGPPKTVLPYAFTLDEARPTGSPCTNGCATTPSLRKRTSRRHETQSRRASVPTARLTSATSPRSKPFTTNSRTSTPSEVKRQLWQNLLTAALGEIAGSPDQMDDLFVRHTYLTAVIGMVVQARFGTDIRHLAEADPGDLLYGRDFRNKTGLQGVVESDFFAWPTEVGGLPMLKTLASRVARFDWQKAPNDVAAILYETVIPPDERRQLGEYYTPDWLARTMVREVVTDPLDQHVLDPACGSGTFVAEAVEHFNEAAAGSLLSIPRRRWTSSDSPSRASTSTRWRSTSPAPRGSLPPNRPSRPRSTTALPPTSPHPSTSETRSNSASAPGTCSPSTPSRSRWRTSRTPNSSFPSAS